MTTISEDDRTEIGENTDLEHTSTNDIKGKIKEIKDRHKAEMAAKDNELKKKIDKNTELTDKLNKAAEQRNEEKKQLQEKITGLESEIKVYMLLNVSSFPRRFKQLLFGGVYLRVKFRNLVFQPLVFLAVTRRRTAFL